MLFILGLVLIIVGGDKFVDAAVDIAKHLGISELVIGATIVSIGTTLPEILVSTNAAISGSADIAAGNAFGSIICNTAFIAGLTQLLRPTKDIDRSALSWRAFFFFAASAITLAFGIGMKYFDWKVGVILLLLFGVYVFVSLKSSSGAAADEDEEAEEKPQKSSGSILKPLIILFVCAAVLYFGSDLLVDNGIILAEGLGVPQRVIAVTFIALGTSLPELVTAITSIVKGHGHVSVGNILGANLLNLLLVIGIPATVCGVSPTSSAIYYDLPIAIITMAVLAVPMIISKKGSRIQGGILVAIYAAYCIWQFV